MFQCFGVQLAKFCGRCSGSFIFRLNKYFSNVYTHSNPLVFFDFWNFLISLIHFCLERNLKIRIVRFEDQSTFCACYYCQACSLRVSNIYFMFKIKKQNQLQDNCLFNIQFQTNTPFDLINFQATKCIFRSFFFFFLPKQVRHQINISATSIDSK